MPTTVNITLGKDVSITGISNARSCNVTNTANESEVTKFGDTARKYRKGLIEQTIDVECVDAPGVAVGATFTLAGTQTGNASYIVTSVKQDQPLDGVLAYTVSGARTAASA